MNKTIIEKVAAAIHHYRPNRVEPWEHCVESYKAELRLQAIAAIEAMRYLVKCDPAGNKYDSDVFNQYITRALQVLNEAK